MGSPDPSNGSGALGLDGTIDNNAPAQTTVVGWPERVTSLTIETWFDGSSTND